MRSASLENVEFAPLVAPILVSGTGAERLHISPVMGCHSPAARGPNLFSQKWGLCLSLSVFNCYRTNAPGSGRQAES
jgi:hypothetical protein